MRRRAFLAALGAAAATAPFTPRAQQRLPRIGYLAAAPADADAALYDAIRAGLRDFGYIDGETMALDARFSDGTEGTMAELARDLVDRKVDVILTGGPGVYAAHSVTTAIPIVAAVTGDLVAMGLADSLAHPGGNVTGQVFFVNELYVKRVALLKEAKPALTRLAMLVTRGLSSLPTTLRAIDTPIKAMGVDLEVIEVDGPGDCDHALANGAVGGVVVMDVPQFLVGAGPAVVAAAATSHGLPTAGAVSLARNGGLVGYGVDLPPLFRRAATFVDKILKGAKPGDIPVEQATKFLAVVNLKTARALGLDIPPLLLAAADEVIE